MILLVVLVPASFDGTPPSHWSCQMHALITLGYLFPVPPSLLQQPHFHCRHQRVPSCFQRPLFLLLPMHIRLYHDILKRWGCLNTCTIYYSHRACLQKLHDRLLFAGCTLSSRLHSTPKIYPGRTHCILGNSRSCISIIPFHILLLIRRAHSRGPHLYLSRRSLEQV